MDITMRAMDKKLAFFIIPTKFTWVPGLINSKLSKPPEVLLNAKGLDLFLLIYLVSDYAGNYNVAKNS